MDAATDAAVKPSNLQVAAGVGYEYMPACLGTLPRQAGRQACGVSAACAGSALPLSFHFCSQKSPPYSHPSLSVIPLPIHWQVWLHDLLPPGLASNPLAVCRCSAALENVLKHKPGGTVRLRSALVDTDLRREMYQMRFAERGAELGPPAAAGGGGGGEDGATGHASADSHQQLHLQRLESVTDELSERELRIKALKTGVGQAGKPESGRMLAHLECRCGMQSAVALHNACCCLLFLCSCRLVLYCRLSTAPSLREQRTECAIDCFLPAACCRPPTAYRLPCAAEESFTAWQHSRHHKAKEAAAGLLPLAADLAQQAVHASWQRTVSLLSPAGSAQVQ